MDPALQNGSRSVRVGTIHDIPRGEGRCFTLDLQRIAVFHLENGSFRAIDQDCPHRMGPLADGLLGTDHVICPLHQWKIHLETGRVAGDSEARVQTYPVAIQEEEIFVTL